MTTEEIIERANALKASDDPDFARTVSCAFYKAGRHPDACTGGACGGCVDDALVMECRAEYLKKIFARPMDAWDASFDIPIVREKKAITDIPSIGLGCDRCYMKESCPEYSAFSTCSIDWGAGVNTKEPKEVLDFLLALQVMRVKRAEQFELLDGGVPDQNLSAEMDRLKALSQAREGLGESTFSLEVRSKNADGGGLLASIFGRGKTPEALPEASVREIPFEEPTFAEPIERRDGYDPSKITRKKRGDD